MLMLIANPGNVADEVYLSDMVALTGTDLFFHIGSVQEQDCSILLTNTVTFEEIAITGTDYNNDYVFENVPYGVYDYQVTKDCFKTAIGKVTVSCQPNNASINISLNGLVPLTTNNLFFYIGYPQNTNCKITLTNIATNVKVSLTGTNSLGEYKFSNLPFGTYDYSITKDCFEEVLGTVAVDCQPDNVAIEVYLSDMVALTGNNLFFHIGSIQEKDCTVLITNTVTYEQFSITVTNNIGDYELENVSYGTYDYEITKDCFNKIAGKVTVYCTPSNAGIVVSLNNLTPQTANNLFFYVGSIQEEDCKIELTNTHTQLSLIGTNNLDDYVFENLLYGTYDYVITKNCFEKITGSVVVGCQPNNEGVAVLLNGMVPITFNNLFFHIGNTQEQDCKISLTNTTTNENVSLTGTNSLDEYKFSNLPYGTYEYSITKDCFAEVTGTVDVDCQPNNESDEVFLNNLAPLTTNDLYFHIGDVQEEDCTILLTNADVHFQLSTTGTDDYGNYEFKNLAYGTYNYTVTKKCFNTAKGFVTVECKPKNEAVIEYIRNFLPVTIDNTISQNGNVLSANASGMSYQWVSCDTNNEIFNEINQSFIVVTDGKYSVKISNENCSVMSDCLSVTSLDLEKDKLESFSTYPNPVDKNLEIEMNDVYQNIFIEIININGQIVFKAKYSDVKNINLIIPELSSGFYILNIDADNHLFAKKFIKK